MTKISINIKGIKHDLNRIFQGVFTGSLNFSHNKKGIMFVETDVSIVNPLKLPLLTNHLMINGFYLKQIRTIIKHSKMRDERAVFLFEVSYRPFDYMIKMPHD